MEIGRGAESIIYLDKTVTKDRVKKNYRLKEIDDKLRKFRTKREAKVMDKIPVPSPKLINMDDKKMQLEMEFIKGDLLRDYLKKTNYKEICKQIGTSVAKMHESGIIHGDLTTSNLIQRNNEVVFIDFGLSFFSDKIEDMAVDIHLFRQALESKHYKIWEKAFKEFLKGYGFSKSKEVIKRLEQVQARGRNKGKG